MSGSIAWSPGLGELTAAAIQLATLTFSGGRLSDDTVALVMKVPA